MQVSIRLTTTTDAHLLPDVERSSARAFLTQPGLAWIAADRVLDEAQHLGFIAAGLHWVAVDAGDKPVGFLAAERFGPELHIWELSVREEWQGRGIGRRLLAETCALAATAGLRGRDAHYIPRRAVECALLCEGWFRNPGGRRDR